MECSICKTEIFAKDTNKDPKAFMARKPTHKDDLRCEEHKNQ